jgi:hypothetical protein
MSDASALSDVHPQAWLTGLLHTALPMLPQAHQTVLQRIPASATVCWHWKRRSCRGCQQALRGGQWLQPLLHQQVCNKSHMPRDLGTT